MYNVCYRITGNEDDAADALQEAFISAFANLDSYRAEATFGAWLKRIAVNKSITLLKKRKDEIIPEDEEKDLPEEVEVTEEVDGLTVERIKKAMEKLPDGYRAVLSLYLLEGYDHQEIAAIMKISESTSKSQLNRAKTKLRDLLQLNS